MAKYSVHGDQDVGAVNESAIFVECSATPRRIAVYDAIVGASLAAADAVAEYQIYRATTGTAAGQATSAVPLDPADIPVDAVALEDLTTEPTAIVGLVSFPLNQRATFRWVASPGSELVTAAATDSGIGIQKLQTTTNYIWECVVLWEE